MASAEPKPTVESIPEWAPSTMRADEPTLARWIGAAGLVLVTLGSSTLFANTAMRWSTRINPQFGAVFFGLGILALLYHAASDPDLQLRRVYSSFGVCWLILGVMFMFVPYQGVTGGLFLPYGLMALLLGQFFCLSATRHETDENWFNGIAYTIAVIGAGAALVGFVGGNLSSAFLLPGGLAYAIIGLLFLWSFVGLKGADGAGYSVGLFIGAIGLVGLGVALTRCAMFPKDYPMPHGLVFVALSVCYLAIAVGICSDLALVVMTRRELASYFYSPIAYIVLLGMVAAGWFLFVSFVLSLFDPATGRPVEMVEPIIGRYIVDWPPVICAVVMVPVLTMKLLSEERRTNTIEVMLTAPVSETSIVLSKFLAAYIFFLLLWLPWGLFLISLRYYGGAPFDYRPLLSFYLALAFMASSFVAMGLFFSSLTQNQITAAVMTFVAMLLPVIGLFVRRRMTPGGFAASFIDHTSYILLWVNSIEGRLYVPDLMVHASAAVLWLFLTVKVLESRKWR